MFQGYTLPVIGAAAALLIAWQDLHRTTPAVLTPLNAEQRAQFGRNLMSPQRIIIGWVCVGLALVTAFTFLHLGYPSWWMWLVVAAAQVAAIGARVQARARFHAFMASDPEAPTDPAFSRVWVLRLLFGVALCAGGLAVSGGAWIEGLIHGDLVEAGFGVLGVVAFLALLFVVVRAARVNAARARLAPRRP